MSTPADKLREAAKRALEITDNAHATAERIRQEDEQAQAAAEAAPTEEGKA